MDWKDSWQTIRELWPAWVPTGAEIGLWTNALSKASQEDVQAAVNAHKRESPYPTPNLSNILAAVGNIVHERSIGQRERYTRDESVQEWIDRTVASSTPQERARVIEEVQAAAHMPGLMAVGLEKLRSTH